MWVVYARARFSPTSSRGSRVGTALCIHLHGCCGSQGHGGWWKGWSAHSWTASSYEVMEEYGFNSALCEAGICRSKDLKDDIWKMRHLDLQLKIAHLTKACKSTRWKQLWDTLPETKIAPENQWLEDIISFPARQTQIVGFLHLHVQLRMVPDVNHHQLSAKGPCGGCRHCLPGQSLKSLHLRS